MIAAADTAAPGTCPYCRFPAPATATTCPSCSAPHHAECWAENGGCSTTACPGAPGPAPVGLAAPAAPAAPVASAPALPPVAFAPASAPALLAPAPATTGPLPPPPAPRARRRPPASVAVALGVLVLCLVGSALALALSGALGPTAEERRLEQFRADARLALREFDALDQELDDGLRPVEYGVLVDRVGDAYGDLWAATPDELRGTPAVDGLADALREYRAARTAWDDALACTILCDDVDPTLQDHWSAATDRLDDVHDELEVGS
jgi:type II secretory pathway pseudopilin PulG